MGSARRWSNSLCEPLLDVIPIHRRENDGAIITQFDMGACESTGLLKMDFLGLRNLSVLDDALINIKTNKGVKVVLEDLTLDDKKTYELLSRGATREYSSLTVAQCVRCSNLWRQIISVTFQL
jgi:DNA polymerase III alpha subunit